MIAAAGTVALALYVQLTPGASRIRPIDDGQKGIPGPSLTQSNNVLIPVAKFEEGKLHFQSRSFPLDSGADRKLEAVKEFLRDSGLLPNVRLMSVDVQDGVAGLHFSEGLDSGMSSTDEATLIYGLRAVLGQFEDVQGVRIFEEGQQLEELGHFEIGDSVPTIPVNRWTNPGEPSESSEQTPPPSLPR
jgi:hypothetical protein